MVKDYKQNFAAEYDIFHRIMQKKQANQKDDFSSLDKASTLLEQSMLEYPETLYYIFQKFLDEDDWNYFNSKKGVRWFARRFPEFRIAKKV